MVPERWLLDVFGATVKFTVPPPVPEPGCATVIQGNPLVAVQLQVEAVVTVRLPVAPAASALLVPGLSA